MNAIAVDANTISVLDTLHKLDNEFGAMAAAFINGEFALWVGSGISRKVPSLGDLVTAAVEFLRRKTIDNATSVRFRPALTSALKLAKVRIAEIEKDIDRPFREWPSYITIRDELWNRYSELLDIRIPGEPIDFMLWDAVDVRSAFSHPAPPSCEHLSIAILVLEGAIQEIASANWDGFIESAVAQLSGAVAGNLQVVVDPAHLRDQPGKARLLKFHGCIVHATDNPATYRKSLIATKTQLLNWPDAPETAATRAEVVSVATNLKALIVGLSLQDVNLQSVFVKARQANPWPWPCAPRAQAHVFCENEVSDGQRQLLKTVYADTYNDYVDDIEGRAHLKAWGEQVLLALVLKMIAGKLEVLIRRSLEGKPIAVDAGELVTSVVRLRDGIAELASGDRTVFANNAISLWSRIISLFRTGRLPIATHAYQPISGARVSQLSDDANVEAMSFGELGIALALFSDGQARGLWQLAVPISNDLAGGALTSIASWAGAQPRPIFFVRTAGIALGLEKRGAFANDNAIVIHADDAWHQLQPSGTVSSRTPRRAPGRVGSLTTLHVSVSQLLDEEPSIGSLRSRFVSEITL